MDRVKPIGGPTDLTAKEPSEVRQRLEASADIEEVSELLSVAGNATRLKVLYALESARELAVGDLAEVVCTSVSALSQHLSKLRSYGLVVPRRAAQTIHYRLTDHWFNETLRVSFFPASRREPSGLAAAAGTHGSGDGLDE